MVGVGSRNGDRRGGMLDLRNESPLSLLRGVVIVELSARDLAPLTCVGRFADGWSLLLLGSRGRPLVTVEGLASLLVLTSLCVSRSRPRSFSRSRSRSRTASRSRSRSRSLVVPCFVSRACPSFEEPSVLILLGGGNGSSRSGCRLRCSSGDEVLLSCLGWGRFLLLVAHIVSWCCTLRRFSPQCSITCRHSALTARQPSWHSTAAPSYPWDAVP